MTARTSDPPPIVDRRHAEQANIWVTKWQGWTPHFLFTVISGESLTVHAVPDSTLLYRLLWTGEGVMLYEVGISSEPYRFPSVQNALVFLDALLMLYVTRLGSAAAAIVKAPRRTQDRQSG
jgi:hypothetical protein